MIQYQPKCVLKSGSFLCVVPTLGGLRSLDLILCSTGATEGIDQLWTAHTACHRLCHLSSFSRSAGSVPWAPSWSAFLFPLPPDPWEIPFFRFAFFCFFFCFFLFFGWRRWVWMRWYHRVGITSSIRGGTPLDRCEGRSIPNLWIY